MISLLKQKVTSTKDAYTVIEFLDQLRDLLMATYGGEITEMLQEAAPRLSTEIGDEPF